jgi:2-dehydro-3-deoxyglucarate aldolase
MTEGSAHTLRILRSSGFDYVGIDCQHSVLDETHVANILNATSLGTTPTLVRVSRNRPELIGRVLDAGADGVIVPLIENADDAREAAAACSFPPYGNRSYGPVHPDISRAPAELQSRARCFVMIETAQAVANIEAILEVAGIDGIYVGPADLGIALGYGHQQFPPTSGFLQTVALLAKAATARGKEAAVHSGAPDFAPDYLEAGFTRLTLGSQDVLLLRGASAELDQVERGVPSDRVIGFSPYGVQQEMPG